MDLTDPMEKRRRERREFWREYVVPTAKGLESFAWRLTIGGLVLYLIFRSMCQPKRDGLPHRDVRMPPNLMYVVDKQVLQGADR